MPEEDLTPPRKSPLDFVNVKFVLAGLIGLLVYSWSDTKDVIRGNGDKIDKLALEFKEFKGKVESSVESIDKRVTHLEQASKRP